MVTMGYHLDCPQGMIPRIQISLSTWNTGPKIDILECQLLLCSIINLYWDSEIFLNPKNSIYHPVLKPVKKDKEKRKIFTLTKIYI